MRPGNWSGGPYIIIIIISVIKFLTTYFFLVEAAGGKALPCIVDIRDEKQVQKAVDDAIKKVTF